MVVEALEDLEDLEEEVASRAFLYEHPAAYREGVEAAVTAVRALLERKRAVA